jgi:hypothetical protein
MSADWPDCTFSIVIDPPDTAGNFKGFNVTCEVLDSDFLMQPVNEADYDSETQACVDRQTGVKSFYDHYVTKRKKKKGLKGVGVECPAPKRGEPSSSSLLSIPVAASGCGRLGAEMASAPNFPDPNYLAPPSCLAVPKGVLDNVAVRRIACGRMPPRRDEVAAVMAATDEAQLREASSMARTSNRICSAATKPSDAASSYSSSPGACESGSLETLVCFSEQSPEEECS